MGFHESSEKILAHADYDHDGHFWWPNGSKPGISSGPIHLHNFLGCWLNISMRILGISAFYHDSAATLIDGDHIIAAAQEERFTRIKHDARFPANAIAYCLSEAGVTMEDVDYVAFYDKPFLKFERLLETYLAFAPRGFKSFKMAMPIWLKEKLFQKDLLRKEFQKYDKTFDWQNKLLFAEHHQSHAASAFYPSPFHDAVVLTMDGVGEWATTSVAIGSGNLLEMTREIHFPHSLGLLYSAFTYYTGFKVNSGEYKVMGLAPYGEPKYAQTILDNLIDVKSDGSFRMDQTYFNYCTGLTMTNRRFDVLFGGPPRNPEEQLEQRHMDLAASVQAVTEEVMLRITRALARNPTNQPLLGRRGKGIASATVRCYATGHSKISGYSQRQVTLAALLGPRLPPITIIWGINGRPTGRLMPCAELISAQYTQGDTEDRLRTQVPFIQFLSDKDVIEQTAQALAEEKPSMDAGANGIWAPRPWWTIFPGRSAFSDHAEDAQFKSKISRELQALCTFGAKRRRGRLVRTEGRQPLHADGC